MYKSRKKLYQKIEKERSSKVICFVTGDRPGLETRIANDSYNFFSNHLDKIGVVKKISLVLHTRGGDTMAAWSIISLIQQFCDEYEVIVPMRAQSAGTLMCLGAHKIVMTKQATLGPIDPSITNPLNPTHPQNQHIQLPISVEAIQGYFDLAASELHITDQDQRANIFLKLADSIHPLVLGHAFRARSQIQALARKLLNGRMEEARIDKIVAFLCSDSGSHDYPIHRREARDQLGLPVEKPSQDFYELIKETYDQVEVDIQSTAKLDPASALSGKQQQDYRYTRAFVESIDGGSDAFVTEGEYSMVMQPSPANPMGVPAVQDTRKFEGWKHFTQ